MVEASLIEAEENMTRINTQSKDVETDFVQHVDSMSMFVKDIRSVSADLQQQALQRAEVFRETFNALFNQLRLEVSKLQEQVNNPQLL
jgi:type IV secretory pathway TrbF-like protein